MATAAQVAKKMQTAQLALIDEQLEELTKHLRKYEPLIEQKRRLEGARRALLSERSPTAGGGKGLTQEEIVNALNGFEEATVSTLATKLAANEGQVRAHLNRGVDERFSRREEGGVVLWKVRDPENDEDEEEDEDDD